MAFQKREQMLVERHEKWRTLLDGIMMNGVLSERKALKVKISRGGLIYNTTVSTVR